MPAKYGLMSSNAVPSTASNPQTFSRREGIITAPVSTVQGITDYGTVGYSGPCPPLGQMIRYQFKVYWLDVMLDLTARSNKHELVAAMKGHVIQFSETVAIYSR